MSQERQEIINAGEKIYSEVVNLYEYNNHLDFYKNIVKAL